MSNQTFKCLVMRYSDPKGQLFFDDFILCAVRLKTMFGQLFFHPLFFLTRLLNCFLYIVLCLSACFTVFFILLYVHPPVLLFSLYCSFLYLPVFLYCSFFPGLQFSLYCSFFTDLFKQGTKSETRNRGLRGHGTAFDNLARQSDLEVLFNLID